MDGAGPQPPNREVADESATGSAKAVKSKGKKGIDTSQPPTMEFDGALGMLLLAIIDDLKAGSKQWNKDVRVDREEMVYLRWPQSFAGYGLTPKTILDEGKSKDWFWIDPYMPMTPVVDAEFEGQQVKAVRLNLEPSYTFLHRSGYGGDPKPKAVKALVDVEAMEAGQKESVSAVPQQSVSEPPEYEPIHEEPPAYLTEVPPFFTEIPEPSTAEFSTSPRNMPALKSGRAAEPTSQMRLEQEVGGPEISTDRAAGHIEVILASSESPQPRVDGKSRTSVKPVSPASNTTEGLGGGKNAEDLSRLSRPARFDRFMAVIASMQGEVVADGWKEIDRRQCLISCKSQGLKIHRQELEIFVSDNHKRLKIDGLKLFYKEQ